jgi:CRP/FNR family cyclic AMP-dependent transcriptional regulator
MTINSGNSGEPGVGGFTGSARWSRGSASPQCAGSRLPNDAERAYKSQLPYRRLENAMSPPTQEEQRRLLKSHFVFGKLADNEIGELLAHAHVERFSAGDEIYAKGSPGQSMMAVVRGSVKIASPSPDGREIVFAIMEAGEIHGEIALLDGHERTADAIAVTDCELLIVYRRDFLPFLQRRADVCIMLLELLCQRLRRTSEQVEDVSFVDLGSRMAKALLRLAHPESGEPRPAVLHVTQRELGNIVGGARESVNRQLQAWQKAGLIELSKGSIAIRDILGLKRVI